MTKRDFIRYSFVFLTFLGVFSTYPKAVYQARAEEPAGDVIYISTPQEFQDINLDLTAHYEIVNDIDFTGFIVNQISSPFSGILNGNNFTLSNIQINSPSSESLHFGDKINSLFFSNYGLIQDINFVNLDFFQFNSGSALTVYSYNGSPILGFSLLVGINYHSGIINDVNIYPSEFTLILAGDYWGYKSYAGVTISFIAIYNFGNISNTQVYINSNISLAHLWKISGSIYFSTVIYNHGQINNLNVQINNSNNLININFGPLETTIINFSGLCIDNYGTISNSSVFFGHNLVIETGSTFYNSEIQLSIFTGTNYGTISNSFVSNSSTINLSTPFYQSNSFDYAISFFVGINSNSAIIENSFVINYSKISLAVNNNLTWLRISAFVRNNEGIVSDSYINGKVNIFIKIITGQYYFNYGGVAYQGSGSYSNIFNNLQFTVFVKTSSQNLTSRIKSFTTYTSTINHENTNKYKLNSKVSSLRFGYLNQGVSSETEETNDYLFSDSIHHLIIDNMNLFEGTHLQWFQNSDFNEDVWAFGFLIDHFGPYLIDKFNPSIELVNNSVYLIGDSYFVTENEVVYLNDQLLDSGTYYFNYLGTHNFRIKTNFEFYLTVNLIVLDEFFNITKDTTYAAGTTPIINGAINVELNGDLYQTNTPITTPGLHTLTIYGENGYEQEITFTIVLETNGVTDESTYIDSVTPTFSGGTATLNGEPFESGTEITDVGNYTLIISGVNEFSEEINFKILPVITGLQDGVTEDPGFQPNITGEGITLELNDDPYTLGTPITTPGLHTLTIYGENGYEQEITFTIVLETNGVTDESTYIDSVTPTFSGGTATLNGEAFESGTEITDVGEYTLLITGVNEFIEEINFKIAPVITGLQNGVTKNPGFVPNITGEGITLELNDDPYTLGTPITTPGLHTLVIFGENGYEQVITFTIELVFNGISNNQTIIDNEVTLTFSGGIAELNGIVIESGFKTDKLGNYQLLITGVSDEIILNYNFRILPNVQGLNNLVYSGNVNPTISGNYSSMTLNGLPYSGTNITMPGDHELIIYGHSLDESNQFEILFLKNFRVNVDVRNVTDVANYVNQTKNIIISGGNATLNSQPIELNHTATSIGHYTLVITGVNDYRFEINFTISPEINSVNQGQAYISSTNIQVLGSDAQLILNGSPITNGVLTQPGQHELVINGVGGFEVRRSFNIVATIGGVTNNAEYLNDSRTITFSGGQATLNGQPIESGYVLDRVGNFELEISGFNDYKLIYTFINLPNVSGVSEGVSYNGFTNIEVLGNGVNLTMNGESFSNRNYSQPGQHELHIMAAGDYLKVINFTILPIVSGGVLAGQQYVNSTVNMIISGGNPTLNGVPISLVFSVNEVGNYHLVIPQTNLPNFEFMFYIIPDISRLQDNRTYNGSVTPTILGEGMDLTLNNKPYVSGTRITNPGQNTIRITSANGEYLKVVNFTITLQFSGLTDGVTYYDVLTPSFSGGVVTLNGEPLITNTEITTYGEFELIIIGDNNFLRTYEFSILPYNISFPQDGASRDEVDLKIFRVHSLTEITLNEVDIRQTRLIQEVGHYDLVITFDGNVISDTRFTVEPQDYVQDGSEFTSPISIHHPFATVKINGREVNQAYRIDIQRQYTIEVSGVNDYYHTYSFSFINENRESYQQLIAPMIVTAIGSLAVFFMRKRWVS